MRKTSPHRVRTASNRRALKACEVFAERAEFNNEAARILVQTLEDFARRYKERAPALVDAALARAELSNGALAIYTLRLIKLKENVASR